jgi:hypothetical protein
MSCGLTDRKVRLPRQTISEKLFDHKNMMDQFAQASSLASNIDIKRT